MLGPCLVKQYIVCMPSFAIISLRKGQLVALLYCLLAVMWILVLCVSSSWFHVLVNSVWFWLFLLIPTYFLNKTKAKNILTLKKFRFGFVPRRCFCCGTFLLLVFSVCLSYCLTCNLQACSLFFVSSWCVNLIRVFLQDDTLH